MSFNRQRRRLYQENHRRPAWVRPLLVILAAIALSWFLQRRGRAEGKFLGVPYDFRTPTLGRVRERLWNEADERILTPSIFGWGYSPNLAAIARRAGLRRS